MRRLNIPRRYLKMSSFSNSTINYKRRHSQEFDKIIQKFTEKMLLLETPTKFNRIDRFLDKRIEYGFPLKKYKKAASSVLIGK